MKIATWNVNSLRVRLPQLIEWMARTQPSVVALQETKLEDKNFPLDELKAAGYEAVFSGQKTYNGVALISHFPFSDVETLIPDFEDDQRRVIAATVNGYRIINLYVPNGQSVGSDKYAYKLMWLSKVTAYIQEQLKKYEKLMVLGDFNIAPEDRDVHDPALWEGCVLVSPDERHALQNLMQLGLSDSFRLIESEGGHYTWWDYRAAGFRRNLGLRIDHILISKALVPLCQQCYIDKIPRKSERPSDHTPVILELK